MPCLGCHLVGHARLKHSCSSLFFIRFLWQSLVVSTRPALNSDIWHRTGCCLSAPEIPHHAVQTLVNYFYYIHGYSCTVTQFEPTRCEATPLRPHCRVGALYCLLLLRLLANGRSQWGHICCGRGAKRVRVAAAWLTCAPHTYMHAHVCMCMCVCMCVCIWAHTPQLMWSAYAHWPPSLPLRSPRWTGLLFSHTSNCNQHLGNGQLRQKVCYMCFYLTPTLSGNAILTPWSTAHRGCLSKLTGTLMCCQESLTASCPSC